eukprot:602249-Pleurochrysis_carterae.AAC.1
MVKQRERRRAALHLRRETERAECGAGVLASSQRDGRARAAHLAQLDEFGVLARARDLRRRRTCCQDEALTFARARYRRLPRPTRKRTFGTAGETEE